MMSVPLSNPTDYSSATPADLSPEEGEFLAIPAECAGMRLDAALARMFPQHSRSRLQNWLKEGLIHLNGAAADAKRKVWGGEVVLVDALPLPEEGVYLAEEIDFPRVYEDECLIIINKPAGLVVHPGSGNWSGTLLNALLHHAPQLEAVPRAGIVHRLDKETSGLMVVAKTLEAQTDLVRQLQARSVKRHYLALVHGVIAQEGRVDAPIGRHPTQRTKMAVVANGREARTYYAVRECFAKTTLVECRLETGRTHQIRVHMASIGHPLVGDPVYGRPRCGNALLDAFPRQALHAWRLALKHPVSGEEMAWEAPLPEDFSHLLQEVARG
jgi:23S rRNA pseudouridine1911/1915/1917 synthase